MRRWLLIPILAACRGPGPHEELELPPLAGPVGGNVLIVLVDDLGVDKLGAYDVHDVVPPTPVIDQLAADGVLFRNAWAHPTCSPTRAALLTGRHPRRTGIGRWIMPWGTPGSVFDVDEVILPEMVRHSAMGVSDAAVGKWHLVGYDSGEPGMHPLLSGFSSHRGTLANPDNSFLDAGERRKGYDFHEVAHDGELSFSEEYLTTEVTNDALVKVAALPEPWLLYVAYNAPHKPLHAPPDHLHPYTIDPDSTDEYLMYDAMVAALDTELGRLLDGLGPLRDRTTVIFVGDNGTPEHAIRPPLDPTRSKGTVYEGGVNVPMIVTGPLVEQPGTESLALVELTDVFPTVAEIYGVPHTDVVDPRTGEPVRIDGISFASHVRDPGLPSTRTLAYTAAYFPNGAWEREWERDAIRDGRYKLTATTGLGEQFFEFLSPADEGPDLLDPGPLDAVQQAAYERLRDELVARLQREELGP